jgi:hypothetical protein
VADSAACVIALVHDPSLRRILGLWRRIDLHALPVITTIFLFSGLQNCSAENFFKIQAVGDCRVVAFGCYIDFPGFPASPWFCTQ